MTGGEKENGDGPDREEKERCDNVAEEENPPNETDTVTVFELEEEEAVREGKEEEKTVDECKKLSAIQQSEKGENFDTFDGNSAVERTNQIQNVDLDTDDDDDEGKLVISEDPHEEDVVEKAELDKEVEELKEKDKDDTEEDDSKAQVSGELAEKESAFGFRFVNECLDEEGFETEEEEAEEVVVEADNQHDVKDSSPKEENGRNGEDLEKVLDEDKIEENTVEENITTGENQDDETDVQDLLEANLEVTEGKIHVDQDETDESESLLKRWQRNKRKRMGHHDRRVLAENASISKRPRRSCQFVKGYFGK